MPTLWAASLRHLLRHPAQLALALTGLALGVATLIAVEVATASSRRAFELSMDAVQGTATHQIVAGPQGVDERLYVRLKTARSPLALAPVVEGYVVAGGRTLQLIGIDLFADPGLRDSGLVAEARAAQERAGADPIERLARWLLEPGALMLPERTAAALGVAPNGTLEVQVAGRTHRGVLVALLTGEEGGYEDLLLTDIAQAQEWLGLTGRLSRVDVRAPDGAAGEAALGRLRAQLPPGVELRDAQRRAAQSLDMTAAFTTNLQAMSLLALLVSVFLIYSAISFAVVQRRRVFGTLRALGATRGQVLGIVLAETAVLGVLGAAAGVLLGLAIGRELIALVSRTINDLYFVVTVSQIAVPAASIVKAVLAGLAVALVAALLPATEVATSAPQLALRRSSLEVRAVRIARWLALASVLLALGAGAIVWVSSRSLLAAFAALFLLLLSVAALTPAALRLGAQAAAHAAGRASPVARLAFGDIAASLSRTGVAVAALGMAVAATIGVSVMVDSFRESLREWLGRTLRADVYVSAPGPGFARPERQLDPQVIEALLATPGIVAHSASRRVLVESPQGTVPLDALELAPESYAGIQLAAGDPAQAWPAFESGAVIVSEPLAWRLQLAPGDRLTLLTAGGPREFPVAAVYREYGNDRGNVYIDRRHYVQWWQDEAITSLGLYLAPGVRAAQLLPALRAAAADRQAILLRSTGEIRELSMRIFERTFVITRVLYWLAAGVAAIGLVSALLAWELERARELALVRSLGLTPRGAAAMIAAQTGFMGLAALLAAIPAGGLTALLLVDVINRRAFGWQIELHVHAGQLGNALLVALGAALLAALYPAWRTAHAPIASEIREE